MTLSASFFLRKNSNNEGVATGVPKGEVSGAEQGRTFSHRTQKWDAAFSVARTVLGAPGSSRKVGKRTALPFFREN
jgi:hypothetical protein